MNHMKYSYEFLADRLGMLSLECRLFCVHITESGKGDLKWK